MWRLFTGSRCWRHASPCWEFWPSLTVFMHTCHQIISKLHKIQRSLNLCKNFTADLTNYSCQNALRNIVFPWYYYTRKGNITTRRISMTLEVRVISHNRLWAPIKFTSKHIPNTIWALQFFIQSTPPQVLISSIQSQLFSSMHFQPIQQQGGGESKSIHTKLSSHHNLWRNYFKQCSIE